MEEFLITPKTIKFKKNDLYNFDSYLSELKWHLKNSRIKINFTNSKAANYQALSLYLLYIMYLEVNNNQIELIFNDKPMNTETDIKKMWENIGGFNWKEVLNNPNSTFRFRKDKPLLTIRKYEDIHKSLNRLDNLFKNINIEYEKSLKYILSELMYNVIEHSTTTVPAIFQFNYYVNKNEVSFIIADCGVGIKTHLSKVYPGLNSDIESILLALKPQVSGTFYDSNPYKTKNNAGVGLFISSNIIKKLFADMYIISGNGLVHISPTDITSKELENYWQGTFIFVNIRLGRSTIFNLDQAMSSIREQASKEITGNELNTDNSHYLHIVNYFGKMTEDKDAAISYRDKYLVPAAQENKDIIIDFDGVIQSPHSFLNALLSSVILEFGMNSFKKIKFKNTPTSIRETIDYILDYHTR